MSPARAIAAALIVVAACRQAAAAGTAPPERRVIVLGIDGMDYGLARSLIAQGRLPHLAALAGAGGFLPVQTSMPPLSPVAWSNFATGSNPGRHGVFDFLRRNPARAGVDLVPEDAVSSLDLESAAREWGIPLTRFAWPRADRPQLLRGGTTLWEVLHTAGVRTTVYKMPANYPAADGAGEVLAGMGTPDITGSYGSATFVTTRRADWDRQVSGGKVLRAVVVDGEVWVEEGGRRVRPSLDGPDNPLVRRDAPPASRATSAEFRVRVDPEEKAAAVTVGEREVVLKEGEWSGWVEVGYDLLPHVKRVEGMVRFYLKQAAPEFRLYVSPVNLVPGTPGLAGGRLDTTLMDALGPYFTKGMSEETKAINAGLFDTREYVEQSALVLADDLRALDFLLGRQTFGLLFVYFSTLDLNCHVLWKHQDPKHPAYDRAEGPKFAASITDLYARLDGTVGKVAAALRPGDVLYVMSDHGFLPMYREFDLPAWLRREGYLAFKPGARGRTIVDVDWANTRAYALGFQSLYLNLKGRERAGTVDPADAGALAGEIRGKLLAVRDTGPIFHGRAVVRSAYRPAEIYAGPRAAEAPDLVLGYEKGYGPADDGVLGTAGDAVVADHLTGFSGHHTADFTAVPGVLFSNRKMSGNDVRLEDITATVLADFSVPAPADMDGRPVR